MLQYVPKTKKFVLTGSSIPREELIAQYGMDLGSHGQFHCSSPYTAAPFHQEATPDAAAQLATIISSYNESLRPTSDAHLRTPFDKELWPFQKASVEYVLRRGGGLIGDQPGLGKTPAAITFANEIKAKRVLVICPASIRLQWATRIREWSTMEWPYHVYPILTSSRGVHPTAQWTIVSYDLCRTEPIGKALAMGLYDLIILDEIHALKTSDSGRTRAVFGDYETGKFRLYDKDTKSFRVLFDALSSRAGAILGLSGTPLLNRPREAYTIARALCWDSIDYLSEQAFQSRFNPTFRMTGQRKDGTYYTYTDEKTGRFQELQYRLRSNFMTRHLKREVMPQLKLPVYDIVRVEADTAIRQALKAESLLDIDVDNFDPDNVEIMGHIAVVRHMMGVAMAPHVCRYAEMLMDGGEDKLVIFAWHKDVLSIFQEQLARYGVVRIDGSLNSMQKDAQKDEFIRNPRKQILVGNIQSMGEGVDGLQHVAAHCLLAEPDWVPGKNVQAIDRLDRGGQLRTVMADLFVAPGSISEKILAKALEKAHNIHNALDRRI